MAITWKFVDTPVSTPATLLDMNDKIDFALDMDQSFDVSPPAQNRSVSGNNMRDGGILTAASYQNRILKFTTIIDPYGVKTVPQKEQLLIELNMELGKAENLLMYKPHADSQPVFFETMRSDIYSLPHRGGSKRAWPVNCEIEAQPFAIGVRQNLINGATITNNPATGTNPARIDLTNIKGDSPSPAFIRLGDSFGTASYFILSQRTRETTITPFVQAESGTQGTNTTTQPNDVLMSGSGNNFSRCTFTTATMATRLTLTIPTTSKGTYRVFARVRGNVGGGSNTYQMRMNFPGATSFPGQTAEFTIVGNVFDVIDLGVFDFPFPAQTPLQFGHSRLSASSYSAQSVEIQAARTVGAGALDFDYFYFMPADERLCTVQSVAAVGRVIIDGPNDMAYGMTVASDPFGATRIPDSGGSLVIGPFGGSPELVPGVTNRWFIMRARNKDIATTYTMHVDHWPRWRVVAIP